jgi:hypothetical protein
VPATHFFALAEDLLPVLAQVESDRSLKYVRMGNFLQPEPEAFLGGSLIPNLCKATSESSVGCESFLVCERHVAVRAERLRPRTGPERFLVDQLLNPDTVELSPGGLWTGDILLRGRVATASQAASSRSLLRRFDGVLRKHFQAVQGCLVGPRAMTMLKAKKRLALAEQSPREFDLAI